MCLNKNGCKLSITNKLFTTKMYLFLILLIIHLCRGDNLTYCDIQDSIESNDQFQKYSHCESVNKLVLTNFQDPFIQFNNLQEISGDLIIQGGKLVRIESSNLAKIGGSFKMKELTSLSLISFPSLKFVTDLEWRVIPLLSNVRFSNEIENLNNIIISDTSLTGFSGFKTTELNDLDINNNRFLEFISADVESIKGNLHIGSNGENLIIDLLHLEDAYNVSISNAGTLNMENLKKIGGSFHLVSNKFEELSIPEVEKIGETFSIINNQVKSVDMNQLKEVNGGLMIINNTNYNNLNFDQLQVIDGGLEIVGHLDSIDFSNIKLIKGSVKLKSNYECTKLKNQLFLSLRGGKLQCEPWNKIDQAHYSSGNSSSIYHNSGQKLNLQLFSIVYARSFIQSLYRLFS